MKTTMKLSCLLVAATMMLASCQKEEPMIDSSTSDQTMVDQRKEVMTFYGPAQPLGNGVVRAWVSQDQNGIPLSVGLSMSDKALQNLPADPRQYSLALPTHVSINFTHVLFDWNPQGHEPPGVYDSPHFDFHFYTMPLATRLSIGPFDSTQFSNAPAAMYRPPAYLHTPGGVPQMGAHWIDLLAPEFNGQPFSRTFIYGSYDGEFIFYEPMITLAHLLSQPDEVLPIRQPQAVKHTGYYPLNYMIKYSTNPKQYIVAITDLTHKTGQ